MPTIDRDDLLARASTSAAPGVADKLAALLGSGRTLELHDGDLEVDGPWSPPADGFVVSGALTGNGSIITAAADRNGGLLILLGPVRCQNMLAAAASTTYCVGPLEVDELLFAATRDVIFYQFGPLRAGALISGAGTGWLTSFHDQVSSDALYDHVADGRTGKAHAANSAIAHGDLLERLVPGVVTFEEWDYMSDADRETETAAGNNKYTYADLDEGHVHAQFYAGQPLLRPS